MSEDKEEVAAPNWMKELEAKRERRLKSKLGHETGAGSPCLECKEKCPGLDLHFWRKICKNCKCGKENHDFQDDDLHGWVQLQLLGSKPKKSQKILLPGKKDEVELEWTPKGSKEAIEKYLKDRIPEDLPIKGSPAAQERKQLLQKQIPVHDLDPTLCHALTEDELKQMNDYINHMKENSVGVGQLVHVNSRTPQHVKIHPNRITDLGKNLQNLNLAHDYENIDAFGKHKLTASLEAIEKKRGVIEFTHPSNAQYAMLLAPDGLPLKDKVGGPLKCQIDFYGNPIFDPIVIEKGGRKAEYAMLLDKNSVPILNSHGNPIKNKIEFRPGFPGGLGNRNAPDCAILLNKNHEPVREGGAPIRLELDVWGAPVIEKSLSEVMKTSQPEFACYLDKNGAALVDKYGHTIKYNLDWLKPQNEHPKYALLFDKRRIPIKCRNGNPIVANLDYFRGPILDDYIMEKLNGAIPHYAMLLDKNGSPIEETVRYPINHMEPIYDKFGNEIRPQFGLLLDKNEIPIKDGGSESPVRVGLDAFSRPIIQNSTIEQLSGIKPEFVMYLDRNGAPILDKYGSPVKSVVMSEPVDSTPHEKREIFDKFGNKVTPKYGLLLDANEKPIKDKSGSPVMVNFDILGSPIISEVMSEGITHPPPQFILLLDSNRAPILDKFGKQVKEPLQKSNGFEPLIDKFGNQIDLNHSTLVDINGAEILDKFGSPTTIMVDPYGNIILKDTVQPTLDKTGRLQTLNKAILLGKHNLPILDHLGRPVQLTCDPQGTITLHHTGRPVYDAEGTLVSESLPPVLDKYGNQIDPHTGKKYLPVQEKELQPVNVPIGAIRDINYPLYENRRENLNETETDPLQNHPYDSNYQYDPIPQCHKCKKIFDDMELAIQIDRSEALWHSNCFKCAGCNQNLADMVYFYDKESDNIYCGRDFAKIRGIPRCNACDELIFVKEYCLAENETYHIKHFCCFECDSPLAGSNYIIENNQPVCLGCYESLKANRCNTCMNIIKPDEEGANLNGTHFHANDACFSCGVCKRPLLGAKFMFRNLILYCSTACFNQAK